MIFRRLADLVLILHFGFVVFVMFGGFLVLRWPRLGWLHVPAVMYGALIEFVGFVCPLTPLEVWFRRQGGEVGYTEGFIQHYITAALYPAGLTQEIQVTLGISLLVLNGIIYLLILRMRGGSRSHE